MSNDDNTQQQVEESTPERRRGQARAAEAPVNTPSHIDVAPRDYDLDVIENFLDLVFHTELIEGEETMMWTVPRYHKPVYPVTEEAMFESLERTRSAKALYFGTATARRNHAGELRNQQALFSRLHVIVLDDIGTKGKASDLPEALQTPTYIMETSPGNFQYGYVLDAPIDNLDAAKALVMIMYEAGIADAGGKMPNKLVRLPEGVNGKQGDKGNFVTTLTKSDGPRWTPQGLLDALATGAEWEEIATNAAEATKRRVRLKGGTTPWAPYRPTRASMSGMIDPVAEWLEERGEILNEAGDWLTIRCPFADGHTSDGDTAGYKPLGAGDDPSTRAFHCFHDSCASMGTRDFLQYVSLLDGPSAGVKDDVAEMVSTYAYDMVNDCAWRIRDTINPTMISMSGLRNGHPRKTLVANAEGKMVAVAEYQRWLVSESRVTVMGPTFNPSTPARLVGGENGDLFINQFAPPMWGDGEFKQSDVDRFVEFLTYLIPEANEREYFLDWLAAKLQDMGFRGAAIVMVAQRQGIGRGTLSDMIGKLIGEVNLRNEPFDKIISDDKYNDWMEAPMVVTNETLNDGGLSTYKVYEKLKDMIDPRPVMTTINPKYGKQRRSMVHSSFLFLSNHSNALSMSEDDRRFYVISNPNVPASAAYFIELNQWLENTDWARSVYRWLRKRPIDLEILLAPPQSTAGKQAMIQESRADIDIVAREILAKWPCEYISAGQFTQAIEHFAERLDLYDMKSYKNQIKRIMGALTYPLAQVSTVKIDNKTTRMKVIINRATEDTAEKGSELSGSHKASVRATLIPENIKETIKNVGISLDEIGL